MKLLIMPLIVEKYKIMVEEKYDEVLLQISI
jgi:hypothetical protein